jgi:hypothetical protein
LYVSEKIFWNRGSSRSPKLSEVIGVGIVVS